MKAQYPYRTKNGKKYYYWTYKDVFGKTREESSPTVSGLEEKIKKRQQLLALGVNSPDSTFEDYLYQFLTTVHFLKLKPRSKERYLCTFNKKLKGTPLGQMKMKQLTVDAIQTFYNQLFDAKQSSSQVKDIHKIISPCLRYAYKKGDLLRDFQGMLVIPLDSPEKRQAQIARNSVKPLTREEHIRFVNGIRGHEYEALFRTAIDTGARQGELFALTWNDINFDTQTIMINKSYSYTKGDTDTYTAQTGPTKCNEIRRNKLPVVLVNILKEHKIRQKCELAEYGVIQTDETLVFSTCIGTHLDASNVYKKLKQVYLDLGINEEGSAYNKNFHDLRHTYATRNFEEGVEPLVISKLLGHADINTTLKTYIHVLNSLRDATAGLTDSFYDEMDFSENTTPGGNIIPINKSIG